MRIDQVALTAGLLLLGAACPRPAPPALPKMPAAMVDGSPIAAVDVRREVWRAAGKPAKAMDPERLALARALLEHLVEQRVLFHAAQNSGVVVDPQEVQTQLDNGRAGYRPEDFNAAVHAQMLTPDSLRAMLTERLTVEAFLRQSTGTAAQISDAQVEQHYTQNMSQFSKPLRIRARQVVVRTEEEAQSVLARLRKGEDFARLAKEYSVAPEKDRGGDLGVFEKGVMPKVFDEACFALQPGQLTPVVQSEYGHHIFQVTERIPEQTLPLDAVREEIRTQMARSAREQAEDALIKKLRAAATVTVDEDVLAWAADQKADATAGGDL